MRSVLEKLVSASDVKSALDCRSVEGIRDIVASLLENCERYDKEALDC